MAGGGKPAATRKPRKTKKSGHGVPESEVLLTPYLTHMTQSEPTMELDDTNIQDIFSADAPHKEADPWKRPIHTPYTNYFPCPMPQP